MKQANAQETGPGEMAVEFFKHGSQLVKVESNNFLCSNNQLQILK